MSARAGAALLALLVGCGGGGAGASDGGLPDGGAPDGGVPDAGGSWRLLAPLPTPRGEVAVAAADGRLFVIGGFLADGRESPAVEAYDPATDRWSAVAPLPGGAPRHHLAVAVASGRVHVLGGYRDGFVPSAATLAYDPVADVWDDTLRPQPVARGAATAQAIGERIYVVGGSQGSGALGRLLAYVPTTDAWEEALPDLPTAREHLASCALDGLLVVVGGRRLPTNLDATELFDPSAGAWSVGPPLPTPRGGVAGVAVGGRCHVFGGERFDRPAAESTFDENEGLSLVGGWAAFAPMPTARHGLGAALLDGVAYVAAGGERAGFFVSDALEAFTP